MRKIKKNTPKQKIIRKGNSLVEESTGEILCDVTPKFANLSYNDYVDAYSKRKIRFLEPMRAEELLGEKQLAVIENKNTVAERKWNGHRGLLFLTEDGNRMFSRNISKQTNWFGENSDQVPHIRDVVVSKSQFGTVLDGELTLPVENCDHRDVQGVTGALPEKAIECQLERGFAVLNTFDILYYKGVNVQAFPYWKRKWFQWQAITAISNDYIQFTEIYCTEKAKEVLKVLYEDWGLIKDPNFREFFSKFVVVNNYKDLFVEVLGKKWEGLILKDMTARYEQKKSKSFVKMKEHSTYDCVIMGYEDPIVWAEGKTIKENGLWEYWADAEDECTLVHKSMTPKDAEKEGLLPVTKFWGKQWIGALVLGVWKNGVLTEVTKCSGFNDAVRQEFSDNKEKYVGRVVEVEAQGILDKKTGSLQNPRYVMLRTDKDSKDCTFEDHIRDYKE